MIQAVAEDEERVFGDALRACRTPESPQSLFYDLREQLEEAEDNKRKLLNYITGLPNPCFDPACGSGNFLVIASRDAKIEAEINERRVKLIAAQSFRQF